MVTQSPLGDPELVQQARQGSRDAFTALVDRHLSGLVSFFRYMQVPPDLIDDVVQETFTRAFLHLGTYDPRKPMISWLITIGRNHYFDIWRRKSKERTLPEDPPSSREVNVEEVAQGRTSVQDLLDHLPQDLRLLVELRIFKDLPFAEVAQILGDNEANTRVRFHRTMLKLRTVLEKEEADDNR